jgi:hypothetical protein
MLAMLPNTFQVDLQGRRAPVHLTRQSPVLATEDARIRPVQDFI